MNGICKIYDFYNYKKVNKVSKEKLGDTKQELGKDGKPKYSKEQIKCWEEMSRKLASCLKKEHEHQDIDNLDFQKWL